MQIKVENDFFSSFYLNKKHKQLICSDPKIAFIQYKDFQIDLLSGERKKNNLELFKEQIQKIQISQKFEKPIVLHLFYEFGFSCVELDELIDKNKPLAIYIEYGEATEEPIYRVEYKEKFTFEPLSLPSFDEYNQKFQKTYKSLIDGECYQLNLTMPFFLRSKNKISANEYINKLWSEPLNVGAYAHATYIDSLGKLFISNSPECLFQIESADDLRIKSMPIKGTIAVNNYSEREEAWSKLTESKKDEAELYMITDLMRNDLTKLSGEVSDVTHKKKALNVPGLIHQFSVVETKLNPETNVLDILTNLFPGGSITGAPKKNVMKLISEIERYDRGFYCGSTILLYQNSRTASINIRSAEVDFIQDEIKYGAGGGVTLLSQAREEYDEALAKLKSFLLLLN